MIMNDEIDKLLQCSISRSQKVKYRSKVEKVFIRPLSVITSYHNQPPTHQPPPT